jgi:hypothetical protein
MATTDELAKYSDDPAVVLKKNGGTGAFGFYVDYILYAKSTGKLIRQDRFFLAESQLCRYARKAGDKRAAWRAEAYAAPAAARAALLKEIEHRASYGTHGGLEIVHQPLVVELTVSDLEAIRNGSMPDARFTATTAVEKAVGKVDDVSWAPGTTSRKAVAPF